MAANKTRARRKQYYNLMVEGCVEPELDGPYKTHQLRDEAAKKINKEQDRATDGLFWLDISAAGIPKVGSFSGSTFEDEEG